MSMDVKKAVSDAAKHLIIDKKVKKLTVKDIVEECQITRQAFYYHFQDIPDMLEWNIRQEAEKIRSRTEKIEEPEEELRYFFVCASNLSEGLKRSLESNYGAEIDRILHQSMINMLRQVIEERNLYPECTAEQIDVIVRYHANAISGILKEWTPEDTKNLDQIVHTIYEMSIGAVQIRKEV